MHLSEEVGVLRLGFHGCWGEEQKLLDGTGMCHSMNQGWKWKLSLRSLSNWVAGRRL